MLTAASATTHPIRNAGPFTRARREKSIRMTAMIGTGLRATPTAKVRISLMPCPIVDPLAGPRLPSAHHDAVDRPNRVMRRPGPPPTVDATDRARKGWIMGLLRHRNDVPDGRRFQMREKLVSIGDDSWIEDDNGDRVYKVDGKALRVR